MMRRWALGLLAFSLLLGGCAVAPVTPTDVAARKPTASAEKPTPEGPEQKQQQLSQGASTAPPKRSHVDVHGLYMTGWTAGSDRFYELVDYMQQTGLNAVVIDVQDDDGQISWETEIPLAKAIGANEAKIAEIDKRIQYLKEKHIYTIGRIVVYADPLLGRSRPDMAILGGDFVDTRGIRWPDPYNPTVWAYKVDIAKEAARRGFDEIQFDYIRFPEHRIEGYNYHVPIPQRTGAILGFLRYAKQELEPLGVFIAADVFGLTTTVAEGDDMEIGQDYGAMAEVADYILPMVYPSHYAPGTYGIENPNDAPGEIVYQSMLGAQKRTWGLDVKKHRPWIQDFNMGKTYTATDVEAQIRGLAHAGIYQWVLWDPNNRYTKGVDYNIAGFSGPPGAWRAGWELEKAQKEKEVAAREARRGRIAD
jgi:hypothetical protein